MGGKKENFATQSRRQPTSLSFESVAITSVVLTPILTSFVVGLALVDGEHGGKKSRRSWLSALRISIDLVEIDLDRCEAWEQQQGPPASSLAQQHPASQTSRSAKLPPASRTHTHKSNFASDAQTGWSSFSSALRAILPKRSANSTSATRHLLLSGFPRVNSDRNRPIDLPLKRSNGAVTTSAWIDSNTRYHCGPTKLIDDRAMAFERSFSRRPFSRRNRKY
jgi:hypothetical protein